MALIDRCHLKHPFYGIRRIRDWLEDHGYRVNRKKVQRLMRTMDLAAQYPKRNLSLANQAHKVYPYLLRGLVIDRPNQVWATDITYIPMARGFVYLVAIMDWYSRKVLSWRVSNTLDTSFCVDALEEAIEACGAPEIFNTDQGSQFTSEEFTGVLKRHDIRISMDGKGRWVDNVFVERLWRSVKCEDVYLKACDSRHVSRYMSQARHRCFDNLRHGILWCQITRFCVVNLRNCLPLRAIHTLNGTIFHHNLLAPDSIKGSLTGCCDSTSRKEVIYDRSANKFVHRIERRLNLRSRKHIGFKQPEAGFQEQVPEF